MSVIVRNFIALDQTMYEKSITKFFSTSFSILAPQGDPLCQSSPIWVMSYNKAPSIKLPNLVPFWKPLYAISAAKVRDFVDDMTPPHTHTYNFNNFNFNDVSFTCAQKLTYS